MRTHLEFRSSEFPALPGEDEEINPGRHGRLLARFLAAELPQHGYRVNDTGAEDWGWRIDVANDEFPLWIGCGNYEEYDDGFLCFIRPSKPFVRRWFKRIPTTEQVDGLAEALEQILHQSGKAKELRWWSEEEAGL